MSLLNLTSDGLPNILVVLYATLANSRKRFTRESLIAAVAPEYVVKDPKLARTTLNRWIELGLFVEDHDTSELSLCRQPATKIASDVELVRTVRMEARRVALAEENNLDLWAREEARAADLSRSLAWLLAQDVYRLGGQNLFTLANSHVGTDVTLMQNEARASGLKSWGHFLGFIRHSGAVDVDPTVAIRDVLPDCLSPGEGIPARDFVERIGRVLPVVDGGAYRRVVQSRLRVDALAATQANQLSSSLSRAFLGFMVDQTLQFTNKSDVGSSIVLTGRDGLRADHIYTWVRFSV
jgi:hypothetical protein